MDAKLSIGTARHHVNQEILNNEELYGPHNEFEHKLAERISRGKFLKNPAGLMSRWRSIVSEFQGCMTDIAGYSAAVNFSASWIKMQNEIIYGEGSVVLSKIKENLKSCVIRANGLSIVENVLTTASVCAPIFADRHALARWLERQHKGQIKLFEEELVKCLPLVALQLRIISKRKSVVGNIVPFGDGVLVGHCVESLSDASRPVFGYVRHIERRKSNMTFSALPLGTMTGINNQKTLSAMIFRAQTFLGGHELYRYESVHENLIKWDERNQDALKSLWPWLGLCVLFNEQFDLPKEVMPAFRELNDLMGSGPCKFFSVNSPRRRLDSRRVVTQPDLCISYLSSSPHRLLQAVLKPSASRIRRLGR